MNFSELEILLKRFLYNDSVPDFNKFWDNYQSYKNKKYNKFFLSYPEFSYQPVYVFLSIFIIFIVIGYFLVFKISYFNLYNDFFNRKNLLITSSSGIVRIKDINAKEWRNVSVGSFVFPNYLIRTERNSYCEMFLFNKGVYRIDYNTYLEVPNLYNDKKTDVLFKLVKGGITVKSKKLLQEESLNILTPDFLVSVVGTYFKVEVDNKKNTKVYVLDGNVKLYALPNRIIYNYISNYIDFIAYKNLLQKVFKDLSVLSNEYLVFKREKTDILDSFVSNSVVEFYNKYGFIDLIKLNTVVKTNVGKNNEILEIVRFSDLIVEDIISNFTTKFDINDFYSLLFEKKSLPSELKNEIDLIAEETIMGKSTQPVKIKIISDPDNAEIYINNKKIGYTPMEKLFVQGEKNIIKLKKSMYKDLISTFIFNDNGEIVLKMTPEKTTENILTNKIISSKTISKPVVKEPDKIYYKNYYTENNNIIELKNINKEVVFYKNKFYISIENNFVILGTNGNIIKRYIFEGDKVTLTKPVRFEHIILIGKNNGYIYGFDENGKILWKIFVGELNTEISPLVYDGYAYITVKDQVIIIDQNGNIIEKLKLSSNISSTPIIDGDNGNLIYSTEKGEIVVYDLLTKSKVWTRIFGSKVIKNLLKDSNSIFAFMGNNGNRIVRLNLIDGSIIWEVNIDEIKNFKKSFLLENNLIIIYDNNILLLNKGNGNILNNYTFDENLTMHYNINNLLIFGSEKGSIYCFNLNNFKPEWKLYSGEKNSISSVFVDNYNIYVLSDKRIYKIKNK